MRVHLEQLYYYLVASCSVTTAHDCLLCTLLGEHPRIGALDVCPFIPVTNVTTEECVEYSRQFGRQLAEEMSVPVYLYEEAQEKEYRKSLSEIRKGEYEGLQEKVYDFT